MAEDKLEDSFRKYTFFGDVNLDEARKLHGFVVGCRDKLLQDKALQNVFLNGGYEMEDDERPKNWFDIPSSSWNRRKVALHLSYLQMMMDLAVEPGLIVVRTPSIIVPGEMDDIQLEDVQGRSAELVDRLQRKWITEPNLAENVRKYEAGLKSTLGEYNLQTVLGLANRCLTHDVDPSCEGELEYIERARNAITSGAFIALDSAYYNMGNRHFSALKELAKPLVESDWGSFFVMTAETIQEGLRLM